MFPDRANPQAVAVSCFFAMLNLYAFRIISDCTYLTKTSIL